MKIIYLHQYFNTPEMAGGTRSYEMARRMVATGHDVHMVTSYREKDAPNASWFSTDEAGIQVHWLPVPYSNHMSYAQRIKSFLEFAFASRKKAVELDGDVIFASSTPLTIALPAVPAARKKKIPMVFEVRDLWPEMPIAMGALNNPLQRWAAHKLEHWAYHNAQAVVALSPGMKKGVLRTGYPESNVAVIPNSSDNAEFAYDAEAASEFRAARPWLGERPLLVYAGAFGKVNGVDYIIDVAAHLLEMNSDIRILLVGDGTERESVIRKAKSAGVYERTVFFESKIPKHDVPAMLSAASMAANLVIDLPEARANSANKFFDTLASGTPVLLNCGGWMHDLVSTHGCGLAMWQQPTETVARELEHALQNPEWLQQAGQAARQLAETEFDRDKLAGQLMQVLESAVAGTSEQTATIAPGDYSLSHDSGSTV